MKKRPRMSGQHGGAHTGLVSRSLGNFIRDPSLSVKDHRKDGR